MWRPYGFIGYIARRMCWSDIAVAVYLCTYPVLVMSFSMGATPKKRYMHANDVSLTTKTANASPSVVKHTTAISLSLGSKVWAVKDSKYKVPIDAY